MKAAVGAAAGVAVGASLAGGGGGGGYGRYNSNYRPDGFTCSGDSSKAGVGPDVGNGDWKTKMTDCLSGALENNNYAGATSCKLASGPSFGFYKGNSHYDDAQDCYDQCSPCLLDSINKGREVTTHCDYKSGGHHCFMGYTYGG